MRKTTLRPAPGCLVVLVDGVVTPEPDLMRWAAQVEADPVGRVDETRVGDVRASTVFNWIIDRAGAAFETMTFGDGPWDCRQWRYMTLEQARSGHASVVAALEAGGDPDDATEAMSSAWTG